MALITFFAALILREAFRERKKRKRTIVRMRAQEQRITVEQGPPDVVQSAETLFSRIRKWRPPSDRRFYILCLLIVVLLISIILLIAMTGKARHRYPEQGSETEKSYLPVHRSTERARVRDLLSGGVVSPKRVLLHPNQVGHLGRGSKRL